MVGQHPYLESFGTLASSDTKANIISSDLYGKPKQEAEYISPFHKGGSRSSSLIAITEH